MTAGGMIPRLARSGAIRGRTATRRRLPLAVAASFAAGLSFAFCAAPSPAHWKDAAEAELAKCAAVIAYTDDWLFVNADPARRAVACRIGYGNFSLDSLTRATGLGPGRVKRAAQELMHRNLIAPGGPGLLMPYDAEAAKKLREWAERWCAGLGECGVKQ